MSKFYKNIYFALLQAVLILSAAQAGNNSVKNTAEIDSLIELSGSLQNKGDFSGSDSLLAIARKSAQKIKDKNREISILNQLGINATIQGRLQDAVALFENAITLCKKYGSEKLLADLYENISLAYQDMGRYKKAIDAQFRSLEIRQENHISRRIASNYKKISALYDELDDYEKQEEYIRKALAIVKSDSTQERRAVIAIYNTMGNLFDNKKQYDSSAYYYKLVIKEGRKIGWKRAVSTGIGNLANIFKKQGKYDKALKAHLRAVELERDAGNTMGICLEYLQIAELYEIKNEHRQAISWAQKAYNLAEENKFKKRKMEAAEQLSALYAVAGSYKYAYKYLRMSKALSDSIAQNENKKYLTDIESKYQNELKAKKIELLKAQNHIAASRLKYMIIFIIFSIIIAVLSFQYYRKRNIYRTNELRLQALSAQMNPHFIFNVLGAIQAYMYKNDAKTSAYFLERFAKLSRAMLNAVEKKSVSLEQEIENLKIYIELEQFRYDNSFKYKVECNVEEPAFVFIPPMILQPFVENAIKHGLASVKENGLLTITINEKESEIRVVIEDNGPGFRKTKNREHESKSLKILKNRRLLMQKQLNKPLHCEIENIADSDPQRSGVRITVHLPILDEK